MSGKRNPKPPGKPAGDKGRPQTRKGKGRASLDEEPSGSKTGASEEPKPTGWGDHRRHYNTDSESDDGVTADQNPGSNPNRDRLQAILSTGPPSFTFNFAEDVATVQGADEEMSDLAPPSTRSASPRRDTSATRAEGTSSGASSTSLLSKRRRQPSPGPSRARSRGERNPWLPPGPPARTNFMLDPRVHALQDELDRAQRRIAFLENASRHEHDRGYSQGFAAGWERAVDTDAPRQARPPSRRDAGPEDRPPSRRDFDEPYERAPPPRWADEPHERALPPRWGDEPDDQYGYAPPTHRDAEPDDRYARDMRHAMDESRRTIHPQLPWGDRPYDAGPSRPGPSSHGPPPPKKPRRALSSAEPTASASMAPRVPPPELEIGAFKEGERSDWPDPTRLQPEYRHMAVLPLPSGHAWKPDGSFTAVIPTAKTPGRVNDASSYEELWLALALRRGNANVPDVFTRIHQHAPYSLQGSTGRQAAMGYVLTRQIQEATGWDRHDMGSFLVVLAVLIRSRVVTDRTWEQVRGRDILDYRNAHPGADLPDNVWRGLRQFSRHENHRGPTHGISMSPPATPDAPWVIRTSWTSASFVSILRSVRITGPAMLQLAAYADLFVRTRAANGPLPGIAYDHIPRGVFYTASYTAAAEDTNAFMPFVPPPANDGPSAQTMDVDNTEPPAQGRPAKPAPK